MFFVSAILFFALISLADAQEVLFPMNEFDAVRPSLPEAFGNLETILGDTQDFEVMAAFSTGNRYRKVGRSVGRLKVVVSQNGAQRWYSCTAWLIDGEMLVTNHHCTQVHGDRIQRIVMEMGVLDNVENFDRFEVEIGAVATDDDLDFAIHRVDANAAKKYGTVKFEPKTPSANEELFVIHHPGGQPQRLTRRNCRVVQAGSGRQFRHSCDTYSWQLWFTDFF